MELKFLLLLFLVLLTSFGSIETRRSSGKSSSHGSSRHGSSSRGSSGRVSSGSSTHWSSSSHHGASSGSSSHNTFLHSERTHTSSTGNTRNNSPFRPFATVPPPRHTSNNNNSPFRPFATVPPPKHTSSNNNSPHKPFPTVPSPKHTGFPTSAPPPPGFILPGSVGHTRPSAPPAIHSGSHQPPIIPTRHGSTFGHHNRSTGISPPAPGFNLGANNRPTAPIQQTNYPVQGTRHANDRGSNLGYHNKSGGIAVPSPGFNLNSNPKPSTGTVPALQTHYPTQGSHPGGSVLGPNYPPQPPINPAFANPSSPFYSPYPGHQSTHGYFQTGQTHIQPQYIHSLPPNPAHTVVVVPGQSGGYERTTGDIFKEAIIHAGVRAAVDRIISPHHYQNYHGSNWNNYGTPPSGQNAASTTNTHITNYNYYNQAPGGTGNAADGANVLPNPSGQPYPGNGIQGGSSNNINMPGNSGIYGNSGNYGNPGNYANSGSTGSSSGAVNSRIPSNGQSHQNPNNGNGQVPNPYTGVWDQEILNITEKLFSLDENNGSRFISLNLQKQILANNTNITDESPKPLFSIQPEVYNIPTIRAIHSLYQAALEIENKTRENSRKEEALFIDLVLNTNVMIAAMDFLTQKNLIKNDYYEQKDMLRYLWFTPYDGFSSGFKRIFQGEFWEGILWGIQDWIAFDFHEKAGRANYFSYVHNTDLGKSLPNTSILKTNFKMGETMKTGTALFVGISPELQMALYTICHYTRPNNYCDVSLGGTQFKIYTHMDRYFGKDLINVAFPIL